MVDRYERSAQYANIGQITDAPSRVALSSAQSLERRLDVISQQFYGELESGAMAKGQAYGVRNAPTREQVIDAIANDQDVNALFANPGTVEGSAARKVQAELFRQDAIADLLDKAETIKIGLNENTINLEQVDELVNTLQAEINGTYNILSTVDPDSGVKFNAQANKIGYDVYSTANKIAAKLETDIKKAQIQKFEDNYLNNLKHQLDVQDDAISALVLVQDLRNDVVATYGMLTDGVLKPQELKDKEDGIIIEWIASKIAQKDQLLDFIDGKVTDYEDVLTFRNIIGKEDEIEELALKKEQELNKVLEARQKQNEMLNKDMADTNEIAFFSGDTNMTPTQFLKSQAKLGKFYTPDQKAKIISGVDSTPTSKQEQDFAVFKQLASVGNIGRRDVQSFLDNGLITPKQYSELIGDIIKTTEKYTAGVNEIKLQLGVLENELPTDEKAQYKLKLYNEVIIEFKEIMRQREAENVPLMMIKVAQEVSKDARLKIKSDNRDIEVKDAEKILGRSMPKVIESVDDLAAMSANARKQIYQSHGYNEMSWRTLELRMLEIKEIDAILQEEVGD
jgi:hypothetical protein